MAFKRPYNKPFLAFNLRTRLAEQVVFITRIYNEFIDGRTFLLSPTAIAASYDEPQTFIELIALLRSVHYKLFWDLAKLPWSAIFRITHPWCANEQLNAISSYTSQSIQTRTNVSVSATFLFRIYTFWHKTNKKSCGPQMLKSTGSLKATNFPLSVST